MAGTLSLIYSYLISPLSLSIPHTYVTVHAGWKATVYYINASSFMHSSASVSIIHVVISRPFPHSAFRIPCQCSPTIPAYPAPLVLNAFPTIHGSIFSLAIAVPSIFRLCARRVGLVHLFIDPYVFSSCCKCRSGLLVYCAPVASVSHDTWTTYVCHNLISFLG